MHFSVKQIAAIDRSYPMQALVFMMSSRCRAATKAWRAKQDMSDKDKEVWLTLFREELVSLTIILRLCSLNIN